MRNKEDSQSVVEEIQMIQIVEKLLWDILL